MNKTFDVFLSYNRKDTPDVLELGTMQAVPPFAHTADGPLFDLSGVNASLGGVLDEKKMERSFALRIQGREVGIEVGSTRITIGNDTVVLTQPPIYQNGRLLVPLDFLQKTYGDLAGYTFEWHPRSRQLMLGPGRSGF